MRTKNEILKVSDIVEELLRTDLRCRNDDKWLTYKVMRRFTNIYIPFEDFKRMPAFETVKRVRAKIQNVEGRFTPTDPLVIAKRQQRRQAFKEWAVKGGWE